MPNQTATLQNVAAPQSASFILGPFELFSGSGSDLGPDTSVSCSSTDTTKATVSTNTDGTSTVTLVPGVSGSVSITYTDPSANKGQLDLTLLAPIVPPDVIVATVGSLTVTG